MIRGGDNKGVLLFAFSALVIAIISYPLWMLYHQALNANVLFLTSSDSYMLAGERMSNAYYDTNPPLSIILYLPPAFLVKYTALNVSQAIFIYCLSALGLSLALLHRSLKKISAISAEHKAVIYTVFIYVHTIIAYFYWAEREYFMSLTLVPFMFLQISLTRRHEKLHTLDHLILALGALFIMIKPHYYIAPALILLHRFVTQKRLSVAWDKDSLYLNGFAITYALVLYFLFHDFLILILPDVISLYLTIASDWVASITIGLITTGLMAILLTKMTVKGNSKKLIYLMFYIFIITAIPYYMQGKGYMNHLVIPSNFFLFGFALLAFSVIKQILSELFRKRKDLSIPALFLTTILLSWLIYQTIISVNKQLTHKQYQSLELVQTLQETPCTPKSCSFFIFNDGLEVIHQLALYSERVHASRFPSFWFLPKLIEPENDILDENEKERLSRKYSFMVYEDLKKFAPSILIIGKYDLLKTGKDFDIIDFLSKHSPEYREEFSHYKYEKTITINLADYIIDGGFGDKDVKYDVYIRKNEDNNNPQ